MTMNDADTRECQIDEWTELLYKLHLSRTGIRPTVRDGHRIKSALRHVAVKIVNGDERMFRQIVDQYGGVRQGLPERGNQ